LGEHPYDTCSLNTQCAILITNLCLNVTQKLLDY